MKNEIQHADNSLSAAAPAQTIINNTGDNVIQIANSPGGTIIYCQSDNSGAVYNSANIINTEYYNLFVVSGDTLTDPFFLVEKDRALTTSEGVALEISARYASLSTEAIQEIKTFPSIFATENRQFGKTDADHLALFGFVTDIKVQENGIKVYYQRFCSIPQERLNEIASKLAIKGTKTFNELNRRHWTIKRVPLLEELKAAGLNVLIPA